MMMKPHSCKMDAFLETLPPKVKSPLSATMISDDEPHAQPPLFLLFFHLYTLASVSIFYYASEPFICCFNPEILFLICFVLNLFSSAIFLFPFSSFLFRVHEVFPFRVHLRVVFLPFASTFVVVPASNSAPFSQ